MREKRALHVQHTTIARTGATEQTEQTEQTHIASDDAETATKAETASELVETLQKHRKQSERDIAATELEAHFVCISGLPAPKWDTDKNRKASAARWKNPLLEIWELCGRDTSKAQTIISKAYKEMGDLTIEAPASVLKVAKSIYAKNGFHGKEKEVQWL